MGKKSSEDEAGAAALTNLFQF